jgi:hypothetical protein
MRRGSKREFDDIHEVMNRGGRASSPRGAPRPAMAGAWGESAVGFVLGDDLARLRLEVFRPYCQ